MDNFDRITIGNTITERFLESNRTILFSSIGTEYDLKYRSDLTASQADFSVDDDDSIVFEVVEPYLQQIEEILTNNTIDVAIQDQTTEIIDLYMCDLTGTTSPSETTAIYNKTIAVVSTSGAVVGDCINISENQRRFQGIITAINNLIITFNAPTDQEFTTEAVVCFGEWNMNKNGSVTPVTYKLAPPAGAVWDITRLFFNMIDTGSFTSTSFGAISGGLTNGIILRIKDGYAKNIFSIYNNAGFRERAYDVAIDTTGFFGTGVTGLTCRRTFAGQDKNGVTIRLNGDIEDSLEIIIQDDLTDLDKLAVVVQGHTVE